ncbi:MAG: TetR/AcrR family transcriptional regulator [Ruminococcaceae bacterium]|nr:TetR/AcrR family transcriptional regulator [Oscillospiraceae bacterium]
MTSKSQQAQVKILAHFSRLCIEQGYSKTTMRQLAEACGMSRGHIAFYYKRKDDLLLALIDAFSAQVDALVAGAGDTVPDPATRFFLRHLVQYYLVSVTSEAYQVMAELADRPDYLDSRVERAYGGLLAATAAGQKPEVQEDVFVGCLCAIRSIYPLVKYWRAKGWRFNHLRLFQVFCDALVTQSGLEGLEHCRCEALRWFDDIGTDALRAYVGDLRAFIIGAT